MGEEASDWNDDSWNQKVKNIGRKCNNLKSPLKILCQNIRRLVTKNKKDKIGFFKDYCYENNVLLMNFTETWLDKYVKDDVILNGYQIFRCDRKNRVGGGVAIYVKNEYEVEIIEEMSVGGIEMVAVHIKRLNIVNIVIYRPPDAVTQQFYNVLEKVDDLLKSVNKPEPTVIISGDFNFPFIRWVRGSDNGCRWEKKKNYGTTNGMKSQFNKLIDVMDNHALVQIVEEPTRKENTLDLVFTNNVNMFTNIDVTGSSMSDHKLVELTTNIVNSVAQSKKIEKKEYGKDMNFWHLNFHHEDVNWINVNKEISNIDWNKIFLGKNTKDCTDILMDLLLILCLTHIPVKKQKSRSKIPKERKKLLNRIKMLKRAKHRTKIKNKENAIEVKIIKTEKELLENRRKENRNKEKVVIENMKKKPKVFFDYIKNQKGEDRKIGPLKIGEEYIYNDKQICEILVKQYNSQFSMHTDIPVTSEEKFNDVDEGDLFDIDVNEDIIIDAIGKLKHNSAAGPDGIPSKFLIKTKDSIATPLAIIMRKSLDEGSIPDIFKLAYIAPIHKGGSKLRPEQYRPVSLTSHIMKVFERVLKISIIEHLIKHNLINPGQHGFVPGRSTQSQLLQHYCDIYEAIAEGIRIDTVYLDFAKAFDKVNHKILIEKIVKHKIKGKIGIWLKEFLSNRKYRVVANGEMSEIQDVISGVPQGTVLAAILFVMMIADIDKEVMRSILRCFADDTRTSLKIKTQEDKIVLQKDLDSIYQWASENSMQFNENKFEQMTHGEILGVNVESYKTPSKNFIEPSTKVKDLGVVCSDDLLFIEHIESIITSAKTMQGMLLRTFETREKEAMMTMYNTYIRSKLEYCCLIWSPSIQEYINRLERVQKNFTSRISGMEHLNYHQRLKELKLYSLERRRERYIIINAWQQIEGINENILGLKARRLGTSRRIVSSKIPIGVNSNKITAKNKTLIHSSTARKMERNFNAMPVKLRNVTGVSTETFKRQLDAWLNHVPDLPKIDDYGQLVAAESNSIFHQAKYAKF